VLIENKIDPRAKEEGQLLDYYEAAVRTRREHRIVAMYLAPTIGVGRDEADTVRSSTSFKERLATPAGPDVAGALSWGDVEAIIKELPASDEWFATKGIEAVMEAIAKAAERTYKDWTGDDFLEEAVAGSPGAGLVVCAALRWLSERRLRVVLGNGRTGPLYLTLPRRDRDPLKVVSVYAPAGSVNFRYDTLKVAAPFDRVGVGEELIRRLNAIPGVTIPEDYFYTSQSSYISNEILVTPGALRAFFGTMDWVADLLAAGGAIS
jgi:hypothetical protein